MWHIFADELVAPVPCLHDQWLRTFSLNVVGPSHHQGFLCVFSVYYTHFSATSALLGNVDTVAPAACIRMNCHRWPMVLSPHDEVKLTGHKKLTFGVAKVVLVSKLFFKDYMVIYTHYCQTCYQLYIHIILTIFHEATQCLTLWKISLEKFCKNFFQGCMTHLIIGGRDKITDSLQTIVSNTFSWIKQVVFWLQFQKMSLSNKLVLYHHSF